MTQVSNISPSFLAGRVKVYEKDGQSFKERPNSNPEPITKEEYERYRLLSQQQSQQASSPVDASQPPIPPATDEKSADKIAAVGEGASEEPVPTLRQTAANTGDHQNRELRIGGYRTVEEARQAHQAVADQSAEKTSPSQPPAKTTIGLAIVSAEAERMGSRPKNEPESEPKPQTNVDEWQTPIPIQTHLLSVLSVRHSMLPEALRPWLVDVARRMKAPLDFLSSAAIVMISSLIGTRLAIKPNQKDDWTIIPNLWGAMVGDPSTKKTPSMKAAFGLADKLEAQARKQYNHELNQYKAEQITHEAQKSVFAAQEKKRIEGKPVTNPVNFPDQLTEPVARRFTTNDTTVEKMVQLLNENPTGILQYRDELVGLLAGWDRPGRDGDRAFYLEGWNGYGSKTDDRVGRGTTYAEHLCVSLFGGIQPAKLLGYLRAATGFDNDGFVQRLQLAVFPDKSEWGEHLDEYPDTVAKQRAYSLIEKIANADFADIAFDADEYTRYPYTRFDADAYKVWVEWYSHLNTVIIPSESGLLLEHFSKYGSLMPSLALIFHVVNCLSNPESITTEKQLVTADAARMAVEWCDYLASHARRIYGLLDTQQQDAAINLLKQIKLGHLSDGFKARHVVQKGWTGLDKTSLAESALAELVNHHWLKEVEPEPSVTGRPEAPSYRIHPIIIQKA